MALPAYTSLSSGLFLGAEPKRGAITVTRDPSPAWHRRERRKRAESRTIVRVSKAAGPLSQHHSANSMVAASSSPASTVPDWHCKKPGCASFVNFGRSKSCRVCKGHKGDCHGRNAVPATPHAPRSKGSGGNSSGGGSQGGDSATNQALQKEVRELRARVAELKGSAGGPSGDTDANIDPATSDEAKALDEKIRSLRGLVENGSKTLELYDASPDKDALAATRAQVELALSEHKTKLEALLVQKKQLKPPAAQLKEAEREVGKKVKLLAKLVDEDIPTLQKQALEVQEALAQKQELAKTTEIEVAAAKSQLAKLQVGRVASIEPQSALDVAQIFVQFGGLMQQLLETDHCKDAYGDKTEGAKHFQDRMGTMCQEMYKFANMAGLTHQPVPRLPAVVEGGGAGLADDDMFFDTNDPTVDKELDQFCFAAATDGDELDTDGKPKTAPDPAKVKEQKEKLKLLLGSISKVKEAKVRGKIGKPERA